MTAATSWWRPEREYTEAELAASGGHVRDDDVDEFKYSDESQFKGHGYDAEQPRDAYGRWSNAPGDSVVGQALEKVSGALRDPTTSTLQRRVMLQQLHPVMRADGERVLGADKYAGTNASVVKNELCRSIAARMTSSTKKMLDASPEKHQAQQIAAALKDKNMMLGTTSSGAVVVEPWHEYPGGNSGMYNYARCGTPEADRIAREFATSTMVGQWAGSSNDSIPEALAIQNAAAAEFGLKGTVDWPMSPALRERVREATSKGGGVYKDFLRSQYNDTQDRFKALGINEMTLARGARWNPGQTQWSGEESPKPKPFVSYAINQTSRNGASEQYVRTRPLSSWTSNPQTAEAFANGGKIGMVTYATVPVEQILSSAKTGLGCLHEHEFVVLGGRFRSIATARKNAGY